MSADAVDELGEWIEAIVRELVTVPQAVCVEQITVVGSMALFVLRLDERDVGRAVGRGGRVVESLRSLVAVAGARRGIEARLEVPQARSGRRASEL